jgi:hypothetical protein
VSLKSISTNFILVQNEEPHTAARAVRAPPARWEQGRPRHSHPRARAHARPRAARSAGQRRALDAPAMPSWEPLPAYATLCKTFREANNSKDCTWNVITTVWDARGIKAMGSKGANDMIISVEHLGITDDSKTFEKSINEVPNRVFKRKFR